MITIWNNIIIYNIYYTITNKYSIVLPQAGIELQLLLLDNTKYRKLVPFTITNSTFELIVGKNGAITSFVGADTGQYGTAYGAGHVFNITGTNVTYNSPIAIVRYRLQKQKQFKMRLMVYWNMI